MFQDSPQGTTHYYGDDCIPPHRCLRYVEKVGEKEIQHGCTPDFSETTCKVCNQEIVKEEKE